MRPRQLALLLPIAALACAAAQVTSAPDETLPAPRVDSDFWDHWGDGQAEVSGYELSFTRYGVKREGTAVAIFVTETFSESDRVKADPGRHPESDTFPVLKLNLIQDFPTGVYDYNVMTSSFVGLAASGGRSRGALAKASFSAQEWCGHVYAQLRFDPRAAELDSHSYFDGEADRDETLELPAQAISEDALFHWARGLASPVLKDGEAREVPMLRSLELARLRHTELPVEAATLSRAAALTTVEVPAGRFEVRRMSAVVKEGRRWDFDVEAAWPHRIVRWQSSQGHEGRLIASERMKYWELNGPGGEAALSKLGLKPRAPRTP